MTTKAWGAFALIGCVLLAGCSGSHGHQEVGGQSHWLVLCSDDGECSSGQLCACGVCTVECDAECGDHGRCADVDGRTACENAPAGVASVCLEDCARDADCMASGLACVDHACVAAPVADASGDAGNDSQVSNDAGADVSTPVVDASAGGDVTSGPPGCSPALVFNPCPDDLLCHVDSTCVERGVADEDGLATLVFAEPKGEEANGLYGLGGFVVTDDALFWQDLGSTDANDIHLGNGGIYRFDFATGEVTTITDTLGSPLRGLAVDDDFAYVAEPTRILYFELDGSGAAGAVAFNTIDEYRPSWLVAAGSIYYAHHLSHEVRRMTPATGEDGVMLDTGKYSIASLASDGQRLFIEAHDGSNPPDTLFAVEFDGTGMETVSDAFRNGDGELKIVVHDGLVFSVEGENSQELRMFDIATGDSVSLDTIDLPWMEVQSASNSFVYYALYQHGDAVRPQLPYTMLRAGRDGETEVLRSGIDGFSDVVEKNGYVYWIEGVRILRKAFD